MRTVAVVTVARSDYAPLRPVVEALRADDALEPLLVVSGAHLWDESGETLAEIERDAGSFTRVEAGERPATPIAVAASAGALVTGFANALDSLAPDLVLLLGDRWEMHAAGVAAVPLGLPLAHVHGGETSEGAIDESFRHSLTKLSHLHFAATDVYAQRIIRMGEEPWRVTVSGAPGLDALLRVEALTPAELAARHGISLDEPTLLVTYHPPTLEPGLLRDHVAELVAALEASGLRLVLTYPGADAGADVVIEALHALAERSPRATVVPHLGTPALATMLEHAAAMVGNSSSGIIEAASFGLPVVNVGTRQDGRLRAANVVDVADEREAILAGIRQATSPGFRSGLSSLVNPYGDGSAAPRIVDRLREVELGDTLLRKRFYDGEPA